MKKLQAPEEYWQLDYNERRNLLNQCGPDGPLNSLIPDGLAGLDISDVCDIHDYMFVKARNKQELKEADNVFLKNMMKRVKSEPGFKAFWRKILAHIYYGAVRVYSWFQRKNT